MTPQLKVLFVEDSDDDLLLMARELRRGGAEIVYEQVQTASAMTAALESNSWDVIIADYVLPQFSGMDALTIARANSGDIPFILVSGAVGDETAVLAMKAGANDYLLKNSLRRLLPAVMREVEEAGDRRKIREIAAQLEASEIRHRRLFETTNDGILILDAQTAKVLEVNRFMIDLLGYDHNYFVGKELWEIGVFKNVDSARAAMGLLQTTGGSRYENLPLLRRDGREIPVEFVSNVYLEGTRSFIQCNVRDITNRRLAEAELRRAQDMLQSVMDNSAAGILVFEAVRDTVPGGTIVDFEFRLANPAAERMLKRRAQDLIGKRLLTVLPGNLTTGLFDRYVEVVRTGRPFDAEQYYNDDGLSNWFRAAAVKVGDGFSVTFEDISERKRSEEALRTSEERFRLLVEGVHEYGIFLLDPDGNVVSWNAGAERIKGYKAHEVIGHNFSMFYPPEDLASGKPAMELKAAIENGRWEDEGWRVRADGTRFWANVMITALIETSGGLRGFSKLVRDISERKVAEEAIRESEGRLHAIVDTAVDGIVTIDDQGTITLFNPAASRIFGFAPEEVIGKEVSLLMPLPLSQAFDGQLASYLQTGIKKVIGIGREVVARRKDGSTFPMDLAVSETLLGEKRFFTGIVRDISERKHVDEELAKAKEAAEAANRSKSEFLANMSHEIRTPMSAILGFANMVVTKDQGRAGRIECAQIIRRNAMHLLELINEILDLSKIEAMQMKVEHASCDLTLLLSEIIALMRPRAVEKGLAFSVAFDGPIPRVIQTDPLRLRQILVNLIGNAMKFTDAGKISLRISDEGVGTPSIVLRVDVKDTGVGMTPDELSRLFKPFTQADESITRKFGGTGLGLTISASLANLLGGGVTVTTDHGIGSTFTLRIGGGPSSGVEFLQNLTESMLPGVEGAQAEADFDIRGRILLVDDGRDNQRLLRMLLSDAGAEVISAENGQIAVELATTQPFDLILMDMQMPVLDGYAATAEIRDRGLTLPIIALTANAMLEDRDRCLACGCNFYLSKPVQEEALLKAVRTHLGNDLSAPPISAQTDPSAAGSPLSEATDRANRIKSRLANHPVIMKALPQFIEGLPDTVRVMTELLARNDLAELEKVIHQVRGASDGYGFDSVAGPALSAEEAIKSIQAPQVISQQISALIETLRHIDGYDESRAPISDREPVDAAVPGA
jgi:PAS domain S-box-containing protein